MHEAVLKAENVSKSYRRGKQTVLALQDISLVVEPGETVAVMGPSGCGKSTLLMLLGGLDRPTTGSVWLKDVNLATATMAQLVELRRSTCGFVFQSDQLLPTLTLQENVALPIAVTGVDLNECQQRARELLESVGLAGKVNSLPREVSGGQRQRAAIARALANAPEVVLADEPTGNLDSTTAKDVIDLFLERLKEYNSALIMVTHDAKVAERTDRQLHMHDGRLGNKLAGLFK
ncbi:MAG TPA: ABC transporter ATP-binding protein [Methanocella sp.]|jgi:putative ABC transport system ATP-binding protein